ncbi:SMI1/KNR4 family protein [Flammeovirga kamogawensis]|uniref:SMI1/KNR4 family protein n=1 Tax=Flammeovirga kamogawensis TaxID=373891 RepID=A0ABX8H3S8_9BACT|nr:SMI1/KNR4 family protein [Flammeovirga kamogawensis]MBB6460275.1 hypothetical protein [Flammeovirga kamogawensis]QWG10086.1 SMI1/KNR4 family protein [Flammeovirga kamogawensis]
MNSILIKRRNRNVIKIEEIKKIEIVLKKKLPNELIQFLMKYSDCTLFECFYQKEGIYTMPGYIVGVSDKNPNIFDLIEGNIFYNDIDWLPFACDYGGWVFNVSLSEKTYGEVWINKFDSGEKNPFEFVSSSLEEFINGLKRVEDI